MKIKIKINHENKLNVVALRTSVEVVVDIVVVNCC